MYCNIPASAKKAAHTAYWAALLFAIVASIVVFLLFIGY